MISERTKSALAVRRGQGMDLGQAGRQAAADKARELIDGLILLCAPCHLAVHTRGRGNVSPGQLSLFSLLVIEQST